MQARLATALAACVWAAPANAEAPLSAIDWLSNSVAAPVTPVVLPPDPGSDVATSATPGDISVTSLAAAHPDPVGLFAPGAAGLPPDLWAGSDGAALAASFADLPRPRLPALRETLVSMMLARAAPTTGDPEAFVTARTDRLLAMGALAEAAALLEEAGPETPEIFRRYFDVALLLGTENDACRLLRTKPDISPTYPARIFCLARGGDWSAAALTLETAETLDILTPSEDVLLARFLDSDIVSTPPDPDFLRNPTPLVFRMLEAVGEPIPTNTLPLAFAHADLGENRGWKSQIDAAEQLARAGAIPAETLFEIYSSRKPSASGGAWERAKTVQALDAAIESGSQRKLAKAVLDAWTEMAATDLTPVLADGYGPRLAQAGLTGRAGLLAEDLGLMSPQFAQVGAAMQTVVPQRAFLAALAAGDPEKARAYDMQTVAIRAGFAETRASGRLHPHLDQGRVGEAMLEAIELFSQGAEGDPDRISDAIYLLRAVGAEPIARRAALELLLTPKSQ